MEDQDYVLKILDEIKLELIHSKTWEVRIGIGEFTGLKPEQIVSSIKLLDPEIMKRPPKFLFHSIPGKIWCTKCGFRGEPGKTDRKQDTQEIIAYCPKCHSPDTIKTSGNSLEVMRTEL